jgi:hypothetical protein
LVKEIICRKLISNIVFEKVWVPFNESKRFKFPQNLTNYPVTCLWKHSHNSSIFGYHSIQRFKSISFTSFQCLIWSFYTYTSIYSTSLNLCPNIMQFAYYFLLIVFNVLLDRRYDTLSPQDTTPDYLYPRDNFYFFFFFLN